MSRNKHGNSIHLHILDTPQEMAAVEELQRLIWPGTETEIVPAHMLLAAAHNGGLVIGAYQISMPFGDTSTESLVNVVAGEMPQGASLVGFVFSFPGIYTTPDGPRLKHHSHMMGVLPEFRDQGIGFALKRAQWQMVRHQGIDRITWTFDPLISRNAYLNIAQLGAVCNIYLREVYGKMRDQLNIGLTTDRFQVDWWVNSCRVSRRLSKRSRLQLDLAHFLAAGLNIVNPTQINADGLPQPVSITQLDSLFQNIPSNDTSMLLVEIPADFQSLKVADLALALEWRTHTRLLFEELFRFGFMATDFVYLPGAYPRSFYVFSNGERTL